MASSSQSTGITGVYLSFYGPDLDPTFMSHLRSSLSEGFIHTYLEFYAACHMGEDATVSRFKGMMVAIVIFSKNYASFSGCLNELLKIMEESKHGKLKVLPVFYSVDPTDVRTPSKSFERAMFIHENKFGQDSSKVQRWREALSEAGSLSCFCFKNHGSDAELIKSVVWRIDYLLGPERRNYRNRIGNKVNEVSSLHLDDEGDSLRPQSLRNDHPLKAPRRLLVSEIIRSYDVFLSFRGPDARHTIISHLYHALCQKGVHTFKDSPELEAGQKRSQLFEALEKSRIAIVMFSKNYARSKWCLEELRIIIELKEQNKLTVIPIFYRVNPEEVRLHGKNNGEKGCYQIAMEEMEAKYGNDNSKMVESWKETLWKAGDLIGFNLQEGKDEGNCVEEVMEKVMKLLNRVPLEVAQCPIGIKARLKQVKPLLKLDPHLSTVCMLGIYGPGGVGKTTLSKAICNDIMNKFDDWCFLSEVRVTPLIKLQKKLLRKLLCEKDLEIQSVDEGKTMIRRRLQNKRVLVILDDVDKCDQLNALAGGIDWFGEGSRIIITTRDSHVLNSSGVQCGHEVKLLSEAEAAHLFQYHASGGRPESIHMDSSLVDRFLVYAKGLPLALVVLGRLLLGRSASDWESLVEKIDQDPPPDIISTLKISFDGLDKDGQEMFLDIACFFNGWDSDYVLKVLASYGYEPTIVKNILVERCLVTIENGKFQMHDLVEAMGKSIASGKCSKDDEIPNRIWSYDGLYDILPKNMDQERRGIKGILLNSVIEDQEPISFECF